MEHELDFYQTPGPYTDPREFRQLLLSVADDPPAIVRFIKKILIHPLDAKQCGVRFDYKKALRSQADHRSVDDILRNPKVNALLAHNTLDFESTPAQRGILSCDHHAVLFASILRLKRKMVRLRCGYAAHIVPDRLVPHWICELFDEATCRWEYIDPERAILKLDRQDFSTGGAIWLAAREGKMDTDQVLPDYREGLDGIKYRLLNDVNALMKNELLNYEWMIREAAPKAPKLFSKPVPKLDKEEWDLLDRLAAYSVDVDARWDELCRLYASYVHSEHLPTRPAYQEEDLRSK